MANTPEGVLFSIALRGESTGITWSGQFRAKERLGYRDRLAADRIRRDLLGPSADAADAEIASIAYMISQLAVRLTEAPAWWYGQVKGGVGGLDLKDDDNVLLKVYQEAVAIEKSAKEKVQAEGAAAQEGLKAIKQTADADTQKK